MGIQKSLGRLFEDWFIGFRGGPFKSGSVEVALIQEFAQWPMLVPKPHDLSGLCEAHSLLGLVTQGVCSIGIPAAAAQLLPHIERGNIGGAE